MRNCGLDDPSGSRSRMSTMIQAGFCARLTCPAPYANPGFLPIAPRCGIRDSRQPVAPDRGTSACVAALSGMGEVIDETGGEHLNGFTAAGIDEDIGLDLGDIAKKRSTSCAATNLISASSIRW